LEYSKHIKSERHFTKGENAMYAVNYSYEYGMCCCRMLYSRAYSYGQVHSSDLCCTDV